MTATLSHEERISALKRFGYEPKEAEFLCIAALHSGYFLRRQYLAFLGRSRGWRDSALIEKLKANRHCRTTMYRESRLVYHLSAKPLYDALGERDNRNRRERQPSTVKNKIMGLDFVLDHPQYQYLATEREKLDYFTRRLGIRPEDLPTRWYQSPRGNGASARYFVDKYPMFLTVAGDVAAPPVVHFCYVDDGMQTTDGFATYLAQYGPLLNALPDFRVIYIAQHSGLFGSARRVFDAFAGGGKAAKTAPDLAIQQLLDHFAARQQYEARDFSGFDTAALIRYREEKKQFAGEQNDALYERFREGGAAAVLAVLKPEQEHKEVPVDRLSTYVLEYDYDLFGTLTSGPEKTDDRTSTRTQP